MLSETLRKSSTLQSIEQFEQCTMSPIALKRTTFAFIGHRGSYRALYNAYTKFLCIDGCFLGSNPGRHIPFYYVYSWGV